MNDGGSAFPSTPQDRSGQIDEHQYGMSLRDYFAAKAMNGFCSGQQWVSLMQDKPSFGKGLTSEEYVARESYKLADAMLSARGKEVG